MVITREEAKEIIPVLQAFIDEKPIQMWNGAYWQGGEDNHVIQKEYIDLDTSEVLPLTHINHSPINFKEYFRIKEDCSYRVTNPCIGCPAHCRQFLLDGGTEWTCGYVICIKNRKDVNPKEAE